MTESNLEVSAADALLPDHSTGLYMHSKCRNWGVAILAWEREDKRGYQFEDGTLRVFKKGYYNLFEEVEPSEEKANNLVKELNRRLERSLTRQAAKGKPGTKMVKAPWSFEDQVKIFRHLYPDGFEDQKWLDKNRGVGASRRLKRHRQAAIDSVQKTFEPTNLQAMIDAERFDEIWQMVCDQLKATDLITSTRIKPLLEMDPDMHRGYALALQAVLHGTGNNSKRFERFISSMGSTKNVNWELATTILGLHDPVNHICVHPTTFRKQIPETTPGSFVDKLPNAEAYVRLLKMAKVLTEKLREEGMAPIDNLDVHDFITETLRPAAGKILETL